MSNSGAAALFRLNLGTRFKQTINIKETIDGDKYIYNYRSVRGKNLREQLSVNADTAGKLNIKSEIDKQFQVGKVYGSYFSLVADPPNKIEPVKSEKIPSSNDAAQKHHTPGKKLTGADSNSRNSDGRQSKADNQKAKTPMTSNTFKLNLNYRSSGKKPRESGGCDDDGSDVSSLEEIELEMEGHTPGDVQGASPDLLSIMFAGRRRLPEFAKFIPVPYPVPLQVQKLPCHKMFPQEWKDAQRALEHDQAATAAASNSDTALGAKHSKKGGKESGRKFSGLSKLLRRRSSSSLSSKKSTPKSASSLTKRSASSTGRSSFASETITPVASSASKSSVSTRNKRQGTGTSSRPGSRGKGSRGTTPSSAQGPRGGPDGLPDTVDVSPKLKDYRRPARYPHPNDARFDEAFNKLLVDTNIKEDPNFCATLYVEMPPRPNMELCHVKTEMSVAAMLSFFHPYNNIQCFWISNIVEKLHELLKDRSLRPKFTSLLHLRKFSAILVLSNDAGNLLKHRNTCFLHSLAVALNLSPHKILVLARNPWLRPSTAPQ